MVFLELRRDSRDTTGIREVQCQDGVSHKIRWGAQGVSRVVTGKSGLHARVEGERIIALESW